MALIPPTFFDSVVAIGTRTQNGATQWIASGFLYGKFVSKVNEETPSYRVYLVTNRHVIDGIQNCILRFNSLEEETAKEYPIDKSKNWALHPNPEIDVAVVSINVDLLKEDNIQFDFFRNDLWCADIDKMNEEEFSEGDSCYTLGFPMGLVGEMHNYVIARSGILARIRDLKARASTTFLVDSFVFPGNSGGPVVSKPEIVSIQGTKSHKSAYLIGIVRGYVSYQDIAISQQTQRPRIIFEENSGLAEVHPIDYIEETIALHEEQFPTSQNG